MSDDVHKILLTPVDRPGYGECARTVADCGHQSWIGPSSRAAVANPFLRTTTVCARCVDPAEWRAAIADQGGLLALPGCREEVNAVLGVAATDQLFTQYRIREHDPEGRA